MDMKCLLLTLETEYDLGKARGLPNPSSGDEKNTGEPIFFDRNCKCDARVIKNLTLLDMLIGSEARNDARAIAR